MTNASTPTGDPQPEPGEIEIHSSDPRLKEFGYLPGGYMWGKCRGCKKELLGVAKYSTRCFDCASAKLIEKIRNPAPQGAPSPAPAGDLRALGKSQVDRLKAIGWRTERGPHEMEAVWISPDGNRMPFTEARKFLSPASPGTVQAPAAGPRCPECGGDGEIRGTGYICLVCTGTIPSKAGAPSAGRPMPLDERMRQIRGAAVWVNNHTRDANFLTQTQKIIELTWGAFEGAGRPMTWTREAVDRAIDEFHDACMELGSDAVYGADLKNAEAKVKWKREALLLALAETSASESVRPEAEPSNPPPTPASGDTAPICPDCDCSPCACLIDRDETGESPAPIREAKAPADEDPTEGGKYVYCHGCSEAGGAGRAIYHLPPACGEAKADPGQDNMPGIAEYMATIPNAGPPPSMQELGELLIAYMEKSMHQKIGAVPESKGLDLEAIERLLRKAGRFVGNLPLEGSLTIEIECARMADDLELRRLRAGAEGRPSEKIKCDFCLGHGRAPSGGGPPCPACAGEGWVWGAGAEGGK